MRPAPLVIAFASLAAAIFVAGRGASQTPPLQLGWPVACHLGVDCEIERYVDDDPSSPAAKDYTCGTRTEDGHAGVDIRLPDMVAQRRGMTVLAAADGQVLRTRDGVADVSVKTIGEEAVNGIGCGNAVVLTHADGFQTAYCHMAKGSVLVKPGDRVKAGQPIGRVGLSGLTEFPHLHFQVMRNGKLVDPFAYGTPPGACNGGVSLWRETPPYHPRLVTNAGFAAAAPTYATIAMGEVRPPAAATQVMVAYVRTVGLKAGDSQKMTVQTPDGTLMQGHVAPLPTNTEQYLVALGRPRAAPGWPAGHYQATYTVTTADGSVVLSRSWGLTL